MNELSIIIPAYNCIETIDRTLDSIVNQKLSIKYEIILVNDCSNYDYVNIIKKYKKYLNIREIKTNKNIGPGGARQYGIDNSKSNYIIFIDGDDCFYDEKSILKMYNKIKEAKADLIIGNFIYERDNKVLIKKNDLTWLHGKIYRRKFLTDNNIRFNQTRANEDNGFNRLILLLKPSYLFLDEIVYVYKENSNSITRKNNRLYKYEGLEGFCYNMNWAMEEAEKRIKNNSIYILSLDILLSLYLYYLDLQEEYDVSKILIWSKNIYLKFIEISDKFDEITISYLLEQKKELLKNDINIQKYNISFKEFLHSMEMSNYNELNRLEKLHEKNNNRRW